MILISPIQFYIFNLLLFGFVFIPITLESKCSIDIASCVLLLISLLSIILLGWFSYTNPRHYSRKRMILVNIAVIPVILLFGFIYDVFVLHNMS